MDLCTKQALVVKNLAMNLITKGVNDYFSYITAKEQKALTYISTNQRLERKQSHWALELLEFANNLKANTIPKKEKKTK